MKFGHFEEPGVWCLLFDAFCLLYSVPLTDHRVLDHLLLKEFPEGLPDHWLSHELRQDDQLANRMECRHA